MRLILVFLLATGVSLAADTELRHDDDRLEGKASRAGTGHVITFEAPKGSWWISRVRIYGSRYGGGYDPAATHFRVSVCDDKLKPITVTEAPYGLFRFDRFEWVEITLDEPVKVPREFALVVEFEPTGSKGIYLGWCITKDESHSALGVAGGRARPIEKDREWMVRAVISKKKPKAAREAKPKDNRPLYRKDFDYLARTVRTRFPALEKKGVDWNAVCKLWRPRFLEATDDRQHLLNVHQLLAHLGDTHTVVTGSEVEAHVPSFDGLFGAGLWIASEYGGHRLVLRALMEGHPLADRLAPGAELLEIDGRPAKIVHREVRQRLKRWHGWSSDHFLDARLSFQFFPFQSKRTLPAAFLVPGGEVVEVELERWGPNGRGLSRAAVTLPDGLKPAPAALSTRLDEEIGYLRIFGGMNEMTRDAFHEAVNKLYNPMPKGILLDCRGMGGGGDQPAWQMAGRFFRRPVQNGTAGRLVPTGDWQFDGPVVMLTDEREVSSAETFTWAMAETGRALVVGRPTGGATIIPQPFRPPSGLFAFRMGVHDRETPIERIQPEGIGSPPHIPVFYEPRALGEHRDPVLATGLAALRALIEGEARAAVIARFRPKADFVWEKTLCEHPRNPMPDFAGAQRRGVKAPGSWARELEAQQACEALLGAGLPPPAGALAHMAGEYEGTRWAEALRRAFAK